MSKRKSRGLLAAGVAVAELTKPLHHKRGLASAGLINAWRQIIGADMATQCSPQKLVRGPDGVDGTLHLRVWGPLALELQHLTPQLIERINGYYGYRAVARLAFHQAPPPQARKNPAAGRKQAPRKTAQPPDPGKLAALAAQAQTVADEDLGAALLDLGRQMLGEDTSGQDKNQEA